MTNIGGENNVLPIDVNLVRFDHPKLVRCKSKRTSAKQGSGDGVEERSCNNALNRIRAPRQWEKNGSTYYQTISNKLPTKSDAKELGAKLDTYLEQYKARELGICPIKRELYGQCFDEVIRQVTLNCAERGSMLINIRDEMNLSVDSYEELYESVVAFGIRKALLREHKKADLENRAGKLLTENVRLKAELANTIAVTAQLEREWAEARDAETKRHAEEFDKLKNTTRSLEDQLESIINDDDGV